MSSLLLPNPSTTWPPTPDEQARLLQALMQEFPKDAVQKAPNAKTHKGYDTIGYGYQYVINRLNEVLGLGGWAYEATYETEVTESAAPNKRAKYSTICHLVLKLGRWEPRDDRMVFVYWAKREGVGGHEAYGSKADAIKGAFTNALKKTAALFGCGHQAYLGILDEDNRGEQPTRQVVVTQYNAATLASSGQAGSSPNTTKSDPLAKPMTSQPQSPQSTPPTLPTPPQSNTPTPPVSQPATMPPQRPPTRPPAPSPADKQSHPVSGPHPIQSPGIPKTPRPSPHPSSYRPRPQAQPSLRPIHSA